MIIRCSGRSRNSFKVEIEQKERWPNRLNLFELLEFYNDTIATSHQKTMSKITLGIISLIVLCGGMLFWYQYNRTNISMWRPAATSTNPTQGDLEQYVGQITTDANGNNVYTSLKYRLSFTYPKGWHVGDNHLGYGTLQLLNYDENTVSPKDSFGVDSKINKIEAGIGNGDPEDVVSKIVVKDPSADYPVEKFSNVHLVIGGQSAIKTTIELVGGEKDVTYSIPLKSMPNMFLGITIYGDPTKFPILDQIVQSLKFSQ